jgi:murein DD-endopeptidase MepM/ murein hydrolase activator NlpD
MSRSPSRFGRRSGAHEIILARGDKVVSLSLPPWGLWVAAFLGVGALAWVAGSTVYIAFHDDIYEAAKLHRLTVERAYEDRIAELRRQVDDINSRQFLDQQAFEERIDLLLSRQVDLEQRHEEIAGLLEDARARQFAVAAPTLPRSGEQPQPASARAAGFDPSRPAPLDPAPRPAQRTSATETEAVDRIQASMDRVQALQTAMLDALEANVEALTSQLSEVSDAVGADLPQIETEEGGVGGPLVELRRLDIASVPDPQISRIREGFERYDLLRAHVSHLPVRSPIDGNIISTSAFGTRLDPFLGRPALHTGIDLKASYGTPVYASAGGRVTIAGFSGGYGRLVEIDHGDGYRTRYGHLSRILVPAGANVAPGDEIGLVGSSGRSTGPHLHYETRIFGTPRDPGPFLKASELLPRGY